MVTGKPYLYRACFVMVAGLCTLLLIFLASFNAMADGDPSVSVSGPDSKDAEPGEKVTYELNIENKGDSDDFDITLDYDDPDEGWTVESSDDSLRVVADGSKTFFVYVTPHDNDSMPEDSETLDVEVVVTARTGGAQDSDEVHTTCVYGYGAEFSTESQTKFAEPDYNNEDKVTFSLLFTNTGSATDDFRLELQTDYTDGEIHHWAQITNGAVMNDIAADSSRSVQMEITVKPYDQDHSASEGEKDFFFRVYSKGAKDNGKESENETTALFKARVEVQDYYFVKIDAIDSRVPELDEGENDSFEIRVENLGNARDTISMVKDGDAPSSGKYSTWQSFDRTSVSPDPDTYTTVNMTVTVEEGDDAEAGQYDLYYHAKSQGNSDRESLQEYNSIIVKEHKGYEMELMDNQHNVLPGGVAAFPVEVRNTGNTGIEVELVKPDLDFEDWETYWAPAAGSTDEITSAGELKMDEETTVYLKVIPSENTAKALEGSYTVPVETKSGSGEDTIRYQDNGTVYVLASYSLEATTDDDEAELRPGEWAGFTVKLENRGNAWDNFSLQLIDSNGLGWVRLDLDNVSKSSAEEKNGYNSSTGMFTLAPWRFIDIPFIVELPAFDEDNDDAEEGFRYQANPNFVSQGDDRVEKSVELKATIEQVYGLKLSSNFPQKELRIKASGDSHVEFMLEVSNLGNGEDQFTIELPAGELEGEKENWELIFRRDGSVIPAGGFSLNALREQDITVEVEVDNETSMGNHTLEVVVSSEGDTRVEEKFTFTLKCRKAVYGAHLVCVNDKNRWNQTANPADMPRNGIEYRFKLENTGDSEDSFLLKVETNTGSGTYRDWEINFETETGFENEMMAPGDVPGSGSYGFLDAGEYIEISLFVKPSEDEEASGNDLDKFTGMMFSATSQMNREVAEDIDFRLIVIRPDLEINPEDIVLAPGQNIREGGVAQLNLTIHNKGDADSVDFDVWVYRSKTDSVSGMGGTEGEDGVLAHLKDVPKIKDRENRTLTINITLGWGEHEIYVYVDKPIVSGENMTSDKDKGNGREMSERNNDATMDPDYWGTMDIRPWLEVTSICWQGPGDLREEVTLQVTVFNNYNHIPVATYHGDALSIFDAAAYVKCKADGVYLEPKWASGNNQTGCKITQELASGHEVLIQFTWSIRDYEDGEELDITVYIEYEDNKNPVNSSSITVTMDDPSGGDGGAGDGDDSPGFELGLMVLALCSALVLGKRKQ